MPKPLPLSDFRAVRIVLKRSDFAYAPTPESQPSDLIDKNTWQNIVTLPDDVSVRTSNHHGHVLRGMDDCWDAWIESVGSQRDPLHHAILDGADEFHAATFNALHGYYRQAFGCLRNALETMAIATYCQVRSCRRLYWKREAGKITIQFGQACDALVNAPRLKTLRDCLKRELGDSMFDQKTSTADGGWARRLYSELSEYEHARPNFRNFDMWQSNGPVFSHRAFKETASSFYETAAICFLFVKMGRPNFKLPSKAMELWTSAKIQPSKIALVAYNHLYEGGKA
jgi:hypothetical protein